MAANRGWRVTNAFMCAIFTLSALVQINDPDPFLWILIYMAAAVTCLLVVMNRLPRWLPWLMLLVSAGWAATIAPRVIGKVRFLDMFAEFEMANLGIEESREMYGLLIIAVWMLMIAVRNMRRV